MFTTVLRLSLFYVFLCSTSISIPRLCYALRLSPLYVYVCIMYNNSAGPVPINLRVSRPFCWWLMEILKKVLENSWMFLPIHQQVVFIRDYMDNIEHFY